MHTVDQFMQMFANVLVPEPVVHVEILRQLVPGGEVGRGGVHNRFAHFLDGWPAWVVPCFWTYDMGHVNSGDTNSVSS